MRIIFVIFFFTISVNSQWTIQVSGTPRHLLNVEILDANTGFISGDLVGGILKTTNGGANWIIYTEPLSDQYNSLSFSNYSTGIAVGPPGVIIRTTDGGLNWAIITRPGGDLGEVQFITQTTVYAAGDQIIKSTDSGLNWSVIADYSNTLNGLYFTDSLTGTVVGTGGLIITTTNGGINWTQRLMMLPVQLADSALGCVCYLNSLTGYAGGNLGIVVKTTNAGINWSYVPLGNSFAAQGIFFTDVNTGFICSQAGRIYRTTNGGVNWVQQVSGITDPLQDVEFIDANTGWVCGFNGRILKTTNGGITWLNPVSTEIPKSFGLEQNYPNPFNPVTKIRFEIASQRSNVKSETEVKLIIYDILGREAAILINEHLKPGTYEAQWDAADYPNGVYYYRIAIHSDRVSSGIYTETKKMVLLK